MESRKKLTLAEYKAKRGQPIEEDVAGPSKISKQSEERPPIDLTAFVSQTISRQNERMATQWNEIPDAPLCQQINEVNSIYATNFKANYMVSVHPIWRQYFNQAGLLHTTTQRYLKLTFDRTFQMFMNRKSLYTVVVVMSNSVEQFANSKKWFETLCGRYKIHFKELPSSYCSVCYRIDHTRVNCVYCSYCCHGMHCVRECPIKHKREGTKCPTSAKINLITIDDSEPSTSQPEPSFFPQMTTTFRREVKSESYMGICWRKPGVVSIVGIDQPDNSSRPKLAMKGNPALETVSIDTEGCHGARTGKTISILAIVAWINSTLSAHCVYYAPIRHSKVLGGALAVDLETVFRMKKPEKPSLES